MRSHDIIGITLAEIAFLVALAFVLISAVGRYDPLPPPPPFTVQQWDSLASENKTLRDSINHSRSVQDSIQQELNQVQPPGRSQQTPSCVEVGIISGPLFRGQVAGANRFLVNGEIYTLVELVGQFRSDLARADDAGCKHQAALSALRGVDATEYESALVSLEPYFYRRLRR